MVPDLSIVDETFDANISSSYFLSIQASLDGFSFSILDPIRNKYIQFGSYTFQEHITDADLATLINKIFEEIRIGRNLKGRIPCFQSQKGYRSTGR